MSSERTICVGMIVGAHGVGGLLKLRSFTDDPPNIFTYKTLLDESGERSYDLKLKNSAEGHFIVALKGIANREDAQALRGTKLYVTRAALPKTKKSEYYQTDLIGLVARAADGRDYGKVMNVHDHGAGAFLEIGHDRKDSFMLPFTDAYVPDVDIKAGTVTLAPPEGWLTPEAEEKPEKPGKSD